MKSEVIKKEKISNRKVNKPERNFVEISQAVPNHSILDLSRSTQAYQIVCKVSRIVDTWMLVVQR